MSVSHPAVLFYIAPAATLSLGSGAQRYKAAKNAAQGPALHYGSSCQHGAVRPGI